MKAMELKRFACGPDAVRRSADRLAVQVTQSLDRNSVLLLTARRSGEGATFVAAQLTRALAELGRTVLLIDADLRSSRLDAAYRRGVQPGALPGLTRCLRGREELDACVYHTDIRGADILPAGGRSRQALPLLSGRAFAAAIHTLAAVYDYVLIDAPPLETCPETLAMAPHADAAVLVVGAGFGAKAEIAAAAESLREADCPVLGAVLNHAGDERARGKGPRWNAKR